MYCEYGLPSKSHSFKLRHRVGTDLETGQELCGPVNTNEPEMYVIIYHREKLYMETKCVHDPNMLLSSYQGS